MNPTLGRGKSRFQFSSGAITCFRKSCFLEKSRPFIDTFYQSREFRGRNYSVKRKPTYVQFEISQCLFFHVAVHQASPIYWRSTNIDESMMLVNDFDKSSPIFFRSQPWVIFCLQMSQTVGSLKHSAVLACILSFCIQQGTHQKTSLITIWLHEMRGTSTAD